jgi:hypothetical protein
MARDLARLLDGLPEFSRGEREYTGALFEGGRSNNRRELRAGVFKRGPPAPSSYSLPRARVGTAGDIYGPKRVGSLLLTFPSTRCCRTMLDSTVS